jgi:hypothetical protein
VFIITPLLRYINDACCGDAGHCTHRMIPDSASKLLLDLGRLHRFIESRLSSFPLCEVIPAGDLLAAKQLRFWPPTLAGVPLMALVQPTQEWRSLLLTKYCPATSRSHSLRRQRLTAVARGSELSPAPLPVATDLLQARSATLVAISCQASPAAAAAAAAEAVFRPTSVNAGATLAVPGTHASTSRTPATQAAAAAAALGPDVAAAMMAATALAPVAVAATISATSLASF